MKFCAIDTETEGREPKFKSGALVSDEARFYTESHVEFITAMQFHARRGYTFAAHNAEYDSSVALWNYGADLSIHYINDAYDCGYWTWGSPRQRAQVWDTVRLSAGMSLADLGEALGVPKYPTPRRLLGEDDWRPSWVCEEHGKRECLECYNMRDAEIVWCYVNMLREFCETHGIALRRSLPAIVVGLWRQWDVNLQQSIRSDKVRSLARAAYHGGRCEPFKYGSCGYVNTYDVRSHYGAILASASLPDCNTLRYGERDIDWHSIADSSGAVEATVWIEPQHIPPIPAVHNHRVYFPVGTVRDAWPIPELRNATSYGVEVLRIHRATYTDKTYNPFATTAPALLEMREDALERGDPRQLLYKFLLNAVIGRLGMRDIQTRRIYRRWNRNLTPEQRRGYELESSNNQVFMVKEIGYEKPSRTANPLWAAIILGEGRMRLYSHLIQAGQSALYCDTDSVHSQSLLPTGDGSPGTLINKGDWNRSLYLGPKLYRLESDTGEFEVRAKGIPRSAADEYVREGHAKFNTTLSVREAVQRGLPASTWIETERMLGYGIGARTINDPSVLRDRNGYSPTSPVVFASDPDGSTVVTNEELR